MTERINTLELYAVRNLRVQGKTNFSTLTSFLPIYLLWFLVCLPLTIRKKGW